MASLLHSIRFTEHLLAEVQDFDCGKEAWAMEVSEWLKGRPSNDCSLYWMKRNTRVWLYKDSENRLVGFGSLGGNKWSWPPPHGPKKEVAIIPAVAIQKDFQGKPQAIPLQQRYSFQIMGDLIERAREQNYPLLGLFVHQENKKAIAFYERIGFQLLPSHGEYDRMVLDLSAD